MEDSTVGEIDEEGLWKQVGFAHDKFVPARTMSMCCCPAEALSLFEPGVSGNFGVGTGFFAPGSRDVEVYEHKGPLHIAPPYSPPPPLPAQK